MVSIFNCLDKYFLKVNFINFNKKQSDKEKYTERLNIKNLITINELLKFDSKQITNLAELILVLSAICSKKGVFLDRICEADDNILLDIYFNHIEKYLIFEKRLDDTLMNQSNLDLNRSTVLASNQYLKIKEDFERDKNLLVREITLKDKENSEFKSKIESLTNAYNDLDLRLKDKEREYEIYKSGQIAQMKAQEDLLSDNFSTSELRNVLISKEMEIVDLKRDYEFNAKRSDEETKKLKEKLDSYEDKLQDYKSLKAQNDKLNSKIKEMNLLKDKSSNYDTLQKTLEQKNSQIESLLKDKTLFAQNLEKLNKELNQEKEKCRTIEFEKRKLEYDLNDMKKDVSRYEMQYKYTMNLNNISEVKKGNLNSSERDDDLKLYDVGGDSLLIDLKEINSHPKNLDKEYQELKNEKIELVKMYKSQIDEIHKLTDEKDKLLTDIDNFKLDIDRFGSEKERFNIDIEKLRIIISKGDLEQQKLKIQIERIENEKRKLEDEIKDLNEKAETNNLEKKNKIKEAETLKSQVQANKNLAEKILKEKQDIITDYQSLKNEFEKYKNNHEINTSKELPVKKGMHIKVPLKC